jgi:hypothetical protein
MAVTELLSEINPLISQERLFLSAFQYIGSNVWMQFYHTNGDLITLIDTVMFDIAEEKTHDEIVNPAKLHRVMSFSLSVAGLHGRKGAVVRVQEDNIKELKIYFSEIAYYSRTRPIHKCEAS